ncbi:MAG: endonuclease/exonuclease/phosphatase family protein [Bacteroidota bacterium]
MKSILSRINAFVALLLLLSYLAPHLPADFFWPVGLLGLAYPAFLLLNLGFTVFWLIFKSRFFLISLVTILIGWNHIGNHINILPEKEKQIPDSSLKVMTYNVQSAAGNKHLTSRDEVFHIIEKANADMVLFQELYFSPEKFKEYSQSYPGLIKLKTINHHAGSNLLSVSRFPSVKNGFLSSKGSVFALFSDLLIYDDTIRIYNLQLASNYLDKEKTIFDQGFHLNDPESQKQATSIIRKLRRGYQTRTAEVKILTSHIQDAPYPVILGGDFNDTPMSYAYHQIKKTGLADAFKKSKKAGMSNTHNENLPPIRIDYILHDKEYETVSYSRLSESASDHFPVTAILSKQ